MCSPVFGGVLVCRCPSFLLVCSVAKRPDSDRGCERSVEWRVCTNLFFGFEVVSMC